jgi:hypothetical protein
MTETGGTPPQPEFNPQSGFPVPDGETSPPPPPYSPAQQYPAQQYPAQQYPAQQYPPQQYPPQVYGQQPYYGAVAQKAPGEGLYVAAAVINWVTLGLIVVLTLGIGILAAAWFIPMTIRIHKDARDHTKHTALGVCTLLFCNLVSGILILVADGERRAP